MRFSLFDIEEIPHHRQRQRLAEPPRPREQRHLRMILQKRREKSRLVHEVIMPAPHIFKIVPPDWHPDVHEFHLVSFKRAVGALAPTDILAICRQANSIKNETRAMHLPTV